MKGLPFLIVAAFLLGMGCNQPTKLQKPSKPHPRFIVGDIDTAKVLAELDITEERARPELVAEKVDGLSDKLDTLELTYCFNMCDCQRWIPSALYKSNTGNLDSDGFYIEWPNDELKLDEPVHVNGTTIRFIGREYKDKRLPTGDQFTVPDPPKGRVFRYYSYEILHPYMVWGIQKFREVEDGDSLSEPTILTVN